MNNETKEAIVCFVAFGISTAEIIDTLQIAVLLLGCISGTIGIINGYNKRKNK